MDFSGLEAGRLTKNLSVPQDQATWVEGQHPSLQMMSVPTLVDLLEVDSVLTPATRALLVEVP